MHRSPSKQANFRIENNNLNSASITFSTFKTWHTCQNNIKSWTNKIVRPKVADRKQEGRLSLAHVHDSHHLYNLYLSKSLPQLLLLQLNAETKYGIKFSTSKENIVLISDPKWS